MERAIFYPLIEALEGNTMQKKVIAEQLHPIAITQPPNDKTPLDI
jgi:hypothetical protein